MKSEKHLQKRQDIINSAFKVWNRNCFFTTSLNDIASSLGLTKQAIYRYFNGKKDLLQAMENQIIQDYNLNTKQLLDTIETYTGKVAVEHYVKNQISFFRNHQQYMTFLISIIRLKDSDHKEFQKVLIKQSNFFQNKFSIPLSASIYILNLIVFFILIGDQSSLDQLAEKICHIFYNGFGTDLFVTPDNYDTILRDNRFVKKNPEDEDKILKAISDVVLEEGPEKASMGKIAARLGMTKSSLYFYFKNKEEMIINTMNKQTESFVNFYYNKVSAYSLIEEQIFAHFVVTASMIIELPKTLPLVHWFITRGMAESLKKPTDFDSYRTFFEQAAKGDFIKTHGTTTDKLIMLVNFCITYEINNIYRKELNNEEKYKLMIGLYELFTHGLNGQNDRERLL
jgi:AcrR family transcriptional regulator